MSFWETVLSQFVSGACVAVLVVLLAWSVTDKYVARREQAQAQRDRDLAAAAELYAIYGQFYGAWKVWDFHKPAAPQPQRNANPPPLLDTHARSGLIKEAAAAEQAYEAFVVRVALEHDLRFDDEVALWCLRMALKQLRYAIRKDEALTWWRSDTQPGAPYLSFKKLMASVSNILMETDDRVLSKERKEQKARNLRISGARAQSMIRVTGHGYAYKTNKRFEAMVKMQQKKLMPGNSPMEQNWEWVVLAQQLQPSIESAQG